MCRTYLFVCVFYTIFGVLNSHSSGNTCHKVKEEFRKISADDLVPDLPVIGKLCTVERVGLTVSCQSAVQSAASGDIKGKIGENYYL